MMLEAEKSDLVFDLAFFAAYEQELADIDVENIAQAALGEILTIQKADGQVKSFAQIRAESEVFFANPWVSEDMQLLDRMATQYAQACMTHLHGGVQELNSGALSGILERGNSSLGHSDSRHDKHGYHKDKKKERNKKTKAAQHIGFSEALWKGIQPKPRQIWLPKSAFVLAA